jgi:hypothetical protein
VIVNIGCGDRGNPLSAGPGCADIGGAWTYNEAAIITCPPTVTFPVSQRGPTTITQNGCDVSWSVQGVPRSGRVTGNALTASGPLTIPTPGFTVSNNIITGAGTISPDRRRVDLAGSGRIDGVLQGTPVSCAVSSTAILTR